MIGIVATLKIQDGKNAEFEAAFTEAMAEVRANEPGNLFYSLVKSRAEPNTYKVLELYKDEEALAHHRGESFNEFSLRAAATGHLTDDADALEVTGDPLDEPRVTEQLERLFALILTQLHLRLCGLLCGADRVLSLLLTNQQHAPQIPREELLSEAEFLGGLACEHAACPRRVQIERVDVKQTPAPGILAGDQDV